jgi:hypothetical protein
MGGKSLNGRRSWLLLPWFGFLASSLLPLPALLHEILVPVAVGAMLVYLWTDSSSSRKWFLRMLLLTAAFLLLAVLLSFGPGVVFVGLLGIWAGTTLWEVFEGEHLEYLAERDRRPRHPESN